MIVWTRDRDMNGGRFPVIHGSSEREHALRITHRRTLRAMERERFPMLPREGAGLPKPMCTRCKFPLLAVRVSSRVFSLLLDRMHVALHTGPSRWH